MYLGPNNPTALSGPYKQNRRMSSSGVSGLGRCACNMDRLQTVDGISLGQAEPSDVPVALEPPAQNSGRTTLMTLAPLVLIGYLFKKWG
jgi:hypothetical protein